VEEGGTKTFNRNWCQDFRRELITADLSANGFEVLREWGELNCVPYNEKGEWIGVVVKRLPGTDEDRHAPAAAVGASLSPGVEVEPDDCRFGGGR